MEHKDENDRTSRFESQHFGSRKSQPLIRRLSSNVSAIIPSLSHKDALLSQEADQRPKVSQDPHHSSRRESQELLWNKRHKTPAGLESHRPCPYDPNKYHSLPKIEKPRCDFCCGLRRVKSASEVLLSHRPCKDCQSKTPDSHLATSYWYGAHQTDSSIHSSIDSICESDLSIEPPRPVSAFDAANRIGNPPRKAALPRIYIWHVSGPGSSSNSTRQYPVSPKIYEVVPPWQQEKVSCNKRITRRDFSRGAEQEAGTNRPRPRLHRLHGLPHSEEYPYIHKWEAEQYFPPQEDAHKLAVEAEAEDSSIENGASMCPNETPQIGGLRLELRGGSPDQSKLPRLRGGSRQKDDREKESAYYSSPSSPLLKLKRWLLICYLPRQDAEESDTDSDEDLPPARESQKARLPASSQNKDLSRRIPLPAYIKRDYRRTSSGVNGVRSAPALSSHQMIPVSTPMTCKIEFNKSTPSSHLHGDVSGSSTTTACLGPGSALFRHTKEQQSPSSVIFWNNQRRMISRSFSV